MEISRLSGSKNKFFSRKPATIGCLLLLCVPACLRAENAQASPSAQNRLITARIAYVAHMPENLDQWLIEDLKAWGKYQITENSQGVDLVIRAKKPQEKPHYVLRNGRVQPRPEKKPPVLSVTAVDWVTGAKLWQANILNESPKENRSSPPGPETDIYARHMAPDQIAQRCATLLRLYVQHLEQAGK